MFKQLYLSEILSELAFEDMNVYTFSMHIHKYIQNKFLTCSREAADPILSQNIDLKYEVPNAKQKFKKCKQPPRNVLRTMASLGSG